VSEDAETYRGRAHQARLAAKATFDKQQRAIFEKLARSYEAMAEDAEWLEGNEPPSSEEAASRPV
jgi:hypothetical protein